MYEFKTTPYDHQRIAFNFSWERPYFGLFMEMGTGKSKVAIDTMGALYEQGDINTALIIAPKGVFDNWVKKRNTNTLTRPNTDQAGQMAAQLYSEVSGPNTGNS